MERRYRKLLRILPRPYREAREEELLGVLMEGSAEGRQWPEAREALSLARLGVRVRLGDAGDGAQVRIQTGGIMRAVATAGTLLLSFTGTVQLALVVWEISIAAMIGVVCVVAYRSVVWPVALAVVAVAALGPVVARGAAHPDVEGSDLVPPAFLACALVVVAGLAVVRDRRAGRGKRPASTS